jgi:hypothetical protein
MQKHAQNALLVSRAAEAATEATEAADAAVEAAFDAKDANTTAQRAADYAAWAAKAAVKAADYAAKTASEAAAKAAYAAKAADDAKTADVAVGAPVDPLMQAAIDAASRGFVLATRWERTRLFDRAEMQAAHDAATEAAEAAYSGPNTARAVGYAVHAAYETASVAYFIRQGNDREALAFLAALRQKLIGLNVDVTALEAQAGAPAALGVRRESAVMQKHAQNALLVQSASNLSGIVHSFSAAMTAIWEEAKKNGHGTEWVNKHPIAVLFAHQCAHLTGNPPGTEYAVWEAAYKACEEIANGTP